MSGGTCCWCDECRATRLVNAATIIVQLLLWPIWQCEVLIPHENRLQVEIEKFKISSPSDSETSANTFKKPNTEKSNPKNI